MSILLAVLIVCALAYFAGYAAGQRDILYPPRRPRAASPLDPDAAWDDIGDTLTACGSTPPCGCVRCRAPETPSEFR